MSRLKMTIAGTIPEHLEPGSTIPIGVKQRYGEWTYFTVPSGFDPDPKEPILIATFEPLVFEVAESEQVWVFKRRLFRVKGADSVQQDELILRIKHAALRHDRALDRIRREMQAFENLVLLPGARRERIPESVRLFVWQRDNGRCVRCGTRERLEFDHIIPIAAGGSSTERNVQLLCESCNRQKGARIQ